MTVVINEGYKKTPGQTIPSADFYVSPSAITVFASDATIDGETTVSIDNNLVTV